MLVAYKIEKKLGNHNCAVDVTATWSPEETDLNVQAVEALPPDDVDVCQSLSSWAPRFAPRVYGLWLPCVS